MRILFDTNVLLDVLLGRDPHRLAATALFNEVEARRLTGLIGATSITTVYYLTERTAGPKRALQDLRDLMLLFEVAPVGRTVLEDALRLGFRDFEDAVLHEAARHADADGIVTRNRKDFEPASLAVYAPEELLQVLRAA